VKVKAAAPRGVNLALDCVGGSFFARTASFMAVDGVWVLYGLLGERRPRRPPAQPGDATAPIGAPSPCPPCLAPAQERCADAAPASSFCFAGGPLAEGPALGMLLRKRLQIRATTLRARSDEYKAALASRFWAAVMHRVSASAEEAKADGETEAAAPSLAPVIADTLDGLEMVGEAFARMRRSENIGTYVIRVSPE